MCKSEKVGVFKKKWISRLQTFVAAVIRNFKQKNFKVVRWNTWKRSYIKNYSQEIYMPNKLNTIVPCKTLCLFACKKSTSSLTSFISSYALRSELDLSRSLASTHSTKIGTFFNSYDEGLYTRKTPSNPFSKNSFSKNFTTWLTIWYILSCPSKMVVPICGKRSCLSA